MNIIYKTKFHIILIILFCLLLTIIWFQDGKLLATGEEGLQLANPTRSIELYKYSWNEVGVGAAYPGVNLLVPLFTAESFFVNLGIPVWNFQAAVFFLLMLIGSCSVYFMTTNLFEEVDINKDKLGLIGILSTLFYLLNPISLLGVWYRFGLSFMMFYSMAPLVFCLFVIGLKKQKKSYIILVPLLTLFFTLAFSAPAALPLLWFLPFTYTISLVYIRRKFSIYPLLYFSAMFIFWLLINLWWILPYSQLSSYAFSSEIDPTQAVGTLKANSQYYNVSNVIRLIHGGFLYTNETFGSIYKTPLFDLFSWLIPIIVFYGLYKLPVSRLKKLSLINLTFLLFLSKGTQPPFGGVFLWFFDHIIFLQVFRNTLEKIGMLLPLIYAPFFSLGLLYLTEQLKTNKKKLIFISISLFSLVLYNWPFFTGALVHYQKRDIRVEVPKTFTEVNKSFPPGNHIILSVPVMGGGSGFYKWDYGYKGADGSEYLFNYPVITKFYDAYSFYGKLLIAESSGAIEHNLVGLAQIFSADIISVRHDTDLATWGYYFDALDRVDKMINSSKLTKLFDSKEVTLWSLPEDKTVSVIYAPSKIRLGGSADELIGLLEHHQFDPKLETFICNNKEKCMPYSNSIIKEDVIEIIPDKIDFEKMSPVKYNVHITNSRGRFLLVFNNSFHPGWIIKSDNQSLSQDKHIVANGYANGFIIDKLGNYDLSLEFTPEVDEIKAYRISLNFILFGISGMLVYSLYKLVKRYSS